jgi:hypothetical protein
MIKDIFSFTLKLFLYTLLLFVIHYYVLNQIFEGSLFFPIWVIYVFNSVLVLLVYITINYLNKQKSNKVFQYFLGLTALKMILAIVFLLPLFMGKSNHSQIEIFNFFIPYFLFLGFEIFSLNKFLQKS